MDWRVLVDRLRKFGIPRGEEFGRSIYRVCILEQGFMKSAPEAREVPFTSETTIDGRLSSFCWTAEMRSGRLRTVTVTDAYEDGHGRLVAKVGGLIPVANMRGPDFDKGELQRYLASIVFCPPALIHHPTLEWIAVSDRVIRVRDAMDATGATVDHEIGEDGAPMGMRAERPRAVGKRTILTPWSATCGNPREWHGLRVPAHLEVSWHLPEGSFTYYRSDITSLDVIP